MDYPKGYVFELMEKGGPTDVREPYFMEAIDDKDAGPEGTKGTINYIRYEDIEPYYCFGLMHVGVNSLQWQQKTGNKQPRNKGSHELG